jgi:2-polyprenyl-3-methyl-5-hydroxy-6-metoxy-1,4-benzoquinol methylase
VYKQINLLFIRDNFKVSDLISIKISEEAIKKVDSIGIRGIRGDINKDKIFIQSESVDVVIMEEVIEHLYNSDLVISEIHRILKRNGILILSTPNLASWINTLVLLLGYQPFSHDVSFIKGFGRLKFKDQTNGHIKSFTLKAMKEYLNYFGFSIIEVKGIEGEATTGTVKRIDRLVSNFSPRLSSHIFIVAKTY